MQFAATILAFATAAMAAPSYQCTLGQYACSKDMLSIKQCNISGQWVEIGACPDGSKCSNIGDTPYCQTPDKKRGEAAPYCSAPGSYYCTGDDKGINVCNAQNELVFNGACPDKTHCSYLNGIPFCVDNAMSGW